jgi:hypothetical protein
VPQIVLALSASVIPVANAFFILLIVIAICEPEPRVASALRPCRSTQRPNQPVGQPVGYALPGRARASGRNR